ncbi:hypothetical protein [Rhizobium giardinii]|uniref:hypothetical protein n=1 Tax=Rhizobium giardinii TaxID=56731 RepID=UPI003D6FEF44
MAILMAVSALFHDRHTQAAAVEGIRFVVENTRAEPAAEHGRDMDCGDEDQVRTDGSGCVSASECAMWVPVSAQVIVGSRRNEPPALAPPSISLPGDVPRWLRPPKVSVIA